MIQKANEVQLNVLPFIASCEHLYYYEGPCRFGQGEALMPGFDRLANEQKTKVFLDGLAEHAPEGIHILEPFRFRRTDDWDNKEENWIAAADAVAKADVIVALAGIGSDDIIIELGDRFDKPIAMSPTAGFSILTESAALHAKALKTHDINPFYRWSDLRYWLEIRRAKKVINTTGILCATRFGKATSYSSADAFNSYELITARLGVRFRFVNIHELLDQMSLATEGGNHTTPGRVTPNITAEELEEAGRMADEMIAGAQAVDIDRQYVINSIVAWMTVRKNMDLKDCCGFTAPCPDTCSTRRVNEMKFTFCLTHSLNMEQGIPSACEFDTAAVLSQQALIAVSGKCPYMGNTAPVSYENGQFTSRALERISEKNMEKLRANPENLYWMHHSVAHRRIADPNAEAPYALRYFAYDQKFGATLRYDFDADEGKKITMCRFSPDGSKLFIALGEIVCGGGYENNNCTQKVIFRVNDQMDTFQKQAYAGNHCSLVYGDYAQKLVDLAKSLGIEPILAK